MRKLSPIINWKSASSNNHAVILGDFNAHVGQALSWKDAWGGTRGGYEIGVGEGDCCRVVGIFGTMCSYSCKHMGSEEETSLANLPASMF